jgi:SAM-dependent methyltransferase
VIDDATPFSTLRRSIDLFSAFRVEQTDPERFYGALAADSVAQLSRYAQVRGATILDVGGGPGYFRRAFTEVGAEYIAVDSDAVELAARARPGPGTLLGSGMHLPIQSEAVDICYSSNVLEHVPDPERMAEEMVRVTRRGGIVFLSYTTWLSPWGGHETSPWHYLGGEYAARRYEQRHHRPPKNRFRESLYPLSAARMLRWSRQQRSCEVVAAIPRYHPRWAWWMARVPGLREVAVWNLALVLRRR